MKNKHKTAVDALIFAAGLIACFFSQGKWNMPICMWIWPACLLYIFRNETGRLKFAAETVLFLAVVFLKSIGISGELVGDFLQSFAVFAEFMAAFWLDRILYPRLKKRIGGWSVLFMPLVYVSIQSAVRIFVSLTYMPGMSQTGSVSLMQAAALIGTQGLTVLILCFAATVLYVLENRNDRAKYIKTAVVYLSVLSALIIWGNVRVAINRKQGDFTVKAAMAMSPMDPDFLSVTEPDPTIEENIEFMENAVSVASGGKAEIIAFGEEAFFLLENDEPAFVEKACETAEKSGIYILLPIELKYTDGSGDGISRNYEYLISPDGEIIGEYTKSNLIPIMETPYFESGDGNILYSRIHTSSGRDADISSVICFDAYHELYVTGMDNRTDILVVPSWCWDAINTSHTNTMRFRAIENGVCIINPTIGVKSAAIDRFGNILGISEQSIAGQENVTFADIPVSENASPAPYKYAAEYLAWLYAAGAVTLFIIAVLPKKKTDE